MKRNKKTIHVSILLSILLAAALVLFGDTPSSPDQEVYKTIEERAEKALAIASHNDMNDHYALFVDYSIPSGTPRLFVWDHHQKKIVYSTHVMHGPGNGSTAEHPKFSNRMGSKCSSLGRFLVTKENGQRNKRGFHIKGLDRDNRTAYERGLMIHGARWVDNNSRRKYIPLNENCCKGCITVSTRGMDYLWSLINREQKPLLLWNYDGKRC